jgi:hypothetical protein
VGVQVYRGNFAELESLIDQIEDPVIYYKDFSEKKRDDYHSDIARLLFNYLSAAQSLVDHTRNYFRKWHSNDGVGKKYQEVVNKINRTPTNCSEQNQYQKTYSAFGNRLSAVKNRY